METKILNTDKFREAAIHFMEHGVYTKLPEDSRAYVKHWKEETKRSLEGYTSPDGIYISGYFYFYLNYCPIYLVEPDLNELGEIEYNDDGTVKGDRKLSFPRFWDGDYKYYKYIDDAEKLGRHAGVLKSRGQGYSFKGASMLNRNFFLIPGSKSYAIASTKEYLLKDGLLTKTWEMMDFINEHTAWKKRRQVKDTELHKKASYKATINGKPVEKGYKSEIIGVTLMNNPNRARGKRGKLILFEEAGSFPNLLQAWQVARPSVEQGNITYGTMIFYGTGGEEGSNFEGLQELFDSPKGYNVHRVPNEWEEQNTDKETAFFVPSYMNKEGYMDKDGNTDITKSKEACEKERKVVLDETKDSNAYKRYVAERCNTPREAMMRLSGNMFPSQDLLGTLARLELDRHYEQGLYKGFMEINLKGEIEFRENKSLKILTKYPLSKSEDKNAPVILFEQPYRDQDGNVPYGIYIAGIDPYDHDQSGTSSLGSMFVLNKVTNRIVAEYTARPETSKMFYEQCRRILEFYNARALYENEKKGIFDYFEERSSLHLLCEEPRLLADVIKKQGVSRKYGIKMPTEVKNYGEGLLHQWLIRDNPNLDGTKNLHKIRSIPLLKELVGYDPDPKKNFDRVMAMICLVYQLEEERRFIPSLEEEKPKEIHEQDFFNRPLFQPKWTKNLR